MVINDSGKSTLLKLLAGQYLPTQGRIDLNQRQLDAYTAREYAACVAILVTAAAGGWLVVQRRISQYGTLSQWRSTGANAAGRLCCY